MSAPGHCGHCAIEVVMMSPGSDATEELLCCDDWQHSNSNGAEWDDECCPACDEQQRLDDLVTEYLRARRYGNDLIAEGIRQALDIIRGEEPGQPSQHGGEA